MLRKEMGEKKGKNIIKRSMKITGRTKVKMGMKVRETKKVKKWGKSS